MRENIDSYMTPFKACMGYWVGLAFISPLLYEKCSNHQSLIIVPELTYILILTTNPYIHVYTGIRDLLLNNKN